MSKPVDITTKILKAIRDEARKTNARLDGMDARFDGVDARFDAVERHIVESEVRTATAITGLAGTVGRVAALLRAQRDFRPRLERCEQEIEDIQRRLRRPS